MTQTKPDVEARKYQVDPTDVLKIVILGDDAVPHTTVDVIDDLKSLGISNDELEAIVIPRRTLERRRATDGKLSAIETDRALRLRRALNHAERVFGDKSKADRWLRKPCKALDGAVPMDLLRSETGAHIVEKELHAIDHGMFA